MCRAILYLGNPIKLNTLLYGPNNSLIKQTYAPKKMSGILNLAGFGMALWKNDIKKQPLPYIYRTTTLPFYDQNLFELSTRATPRCLLAHIRGTPYESTNSISQANVHPYSIADSPIMLAHNGNIFEYKKTIGAIAPYLSEAALEALNGSSDTQWFFALFISQMKNPYQPKSTAEILQALKETIKITQYIRRKKQIEISSPLNLFLSNGQSIIALRYSLDYGNYTNFFTQKPSNYNSLWYTYGKSYTKVNNNYEMTAGNKVESLLIASEPLSNDMSTWIELPEYSIITAEKNSSNQLNIKIEDIGL